MTSVDFGVIIKDSGYYYDDLQKDNIQMNKINQFCMYLEQSETIFDIMAAACKVLEPFEYTLLEVPDAGLRGIVSCFSEALSEKSSAFVRLKMELYRWAESFSYRDDSEIRRAMLGLVRLIDSKCVKFQETSLPDTYETCFSRNGLLKEEICIFPRRRHIAVELLSASIAAMENRKGKSGFYGRNYSGTAGISSVLNNFFVHKTEKNICPVLHIPDYAREVQDDFRKKGEKLRIGIFPLINKNLRSIFAIHEKLSEPRMGVFSIGEISGEQEQELIRRCKQELLECKKRQVDIAVFPEMLFTEKMREELTVFIREAGSSDTEFPWFIWLGTIWEDRQNKCCVMDRYGNIVFEQNKYVPFVYTGHSDTSQNQKQDAPPVIYTEDIRKEKNRYIHILDISDLYRIATAICRDTSDGSLLELVKTLCCDLLVVPAFSETDRLTGRHIRPLIMEQMIAVVCNSCSAQCRPKEIKFPVGPDMAGTELPFCYVGLPAKKYKDNDADFHRVKYNRYCADCDTYCRGHFFTIDFSRCVRRKGCITANVRCH